MKKNYSLIILIIAFKFSFAQTNVINTTGNVGIGTTSPSALLHVNPALDAVSAIKIGTPNTSGNLNVPLKASPGGYNIDFYTWRDVQPDQIGARIRAERINDYQANNALVQAMDLSFYTSTGFLGALSEKMRISNNGNVGIGTTNPIEKLHIVEEGLLRTTFETISSENYIRPILDFKRSRGTAALKTAVMEDDKLGSIYFRGYDGAKYIESSAIGGIAEGSQQFNVQKGGIYFSTNDGLDTSSNVPKMKMYISSNGNVFINPKLDIQGNVVGSSIIGEGKLQVRGSIRAQEVKVEMANWPDYVFAKDYKLSTLQETEKHIKEKGHLPGIPSAAEVEKNGIELGDMNKKLLQKIEELTLYLIQMKRENAMIRKDNEAKDKELQDQINRLTPKQK